jgi:hypothetical protein
VFLVTRMNGSSEPTPANKGWVEFWPINRWERVEVHTRPELGAVCRPPSYSPIIAANRGGTR